ncbi:peptide chain release factor 1 [Candidatus Sumerlaeota bacterium]|nr:peptide chain release factor 1 [Candidatus Sumerlaeota bacterium]
MVDLDVTLTEIEKQWEALGQALAEAVSTGDGKTYRDQARRHAELGRIVDKWHALIAARKRLDEAVSLVGDSDPAISAMAHEEADELRKEIESLAQELRIMLLPRDPRDDRNVILEIRAGTGGEEAALFARDLFRMYCRFAERRGWRIEALSLSPSDIGGIREVIATVQGERVFSVLKFESGTHRVQRIPVTEASGRIHTSAVTVAVLPEAEEVEVEIKPDDLRITVQRSGGPGGQSVNTTDSSVRVMHIPTGLIVVCQDEKSQHKNKAKALRVLRARLLETEQRRQHEERSATRRQQIGTGDRSERIRTYNFPQNRVTDHRIGLTLHRLPQILDGELDEIVQALALEEQTRLLAAADSEVRSQKSEVRS